MTSSSDLKAVMDRLQTQMATYQELKREVENLESRAAPDVSAEIAELEKQNAKMRYRLNILKRSMDKRGQESSDSGGSVHVKDDSAMVNVIGVLETIFAAASQKAFPELSNFPVAVHPASKPQFGDYQFNSALGMAKALSEKGVKKNPREIAVAVVNNVAVKEKSELIESLEIAGPGFVNIRLKSSYVCDLVRDILLLGVRPPKVKRQRVVVDFSSPNIAKEMHVGHLRSTIIGDGISRLCEFVGHDVLRLNHLGDWGTQFGMLITHLQEKFPDFKSKTPEIKDLQTLYKESKLRFDTEDDFKKRAYLAVKSLQSHDPDYILAWEQICEVSRKEFQKIYDLLDIKITDRGESFYQSRMDAVVKLLQDKGLLIEDEGRKVMFAKPESSKVPLTVVKTDGSYTYDTSDMATLKQRIEEEKADRIIYVTDEGQSTHFKTIFSCGEIAEIWDRSKVRVDHATFGVVLGEDGKKFKTRSGDTVRLADLLLEGVRRAEEKLKEKGRDQELTAEELVAARDNVAIGCIKYNDLCHNRCHEYMFSFDKMLEDKGNTAAYLLYQYTRIKSISRLGGVNEEEVLQRAANEPLVLEHEKEIKLAKTLMKFPIVIERLLDDLLLHSLCEYLYEVSQTFSEFYDNCYCIERNRETKEVIKIHYNRLMMCEATARIMAACFNILGVKPVSRM